MKLNNTESKEQFLSGGGEMGQLIRSMDWSTTALGPIESWPQSLRTSVSLCLSSTFPILIAWGPEKIQLYNDSYRPICGAKHPEAMGMNFRICWETALPVVGDAFSRGEQGEGTYINDQQMFLDRYGYLEEAFMTFSFAPIRDESGGVGGIFHPITETTVKILSSRRTKAIKEIGASLGKAKTIQDIGRLTAEKYPEFLLDAPFLLIYQLEPQSGTVKLVSSAGLPVGTALTPIQATLTGNSSDMWPFSQVRESGQMQQIDLLRDCFGDFKCEPYPEAPESAMLLPLKISGQDDVFGFVIAGVSARRELDNDYLIFYDQLANTFNTAVSNVYAYEQEQKRAEALAEIDRSKTAFFSNVSHEFRTPLTLMLGPLEDLLNQGSLPEDIKDSIESARRNALRLLKLVNNLLDYSRVEAGRVQAAYQQLDLTELTTDLASSFRAIIEKAGMRLIVNNSSLRNPVFVDRQMWEKIVLNLLSNAFKYTLNGAITVTLLQEGSFAVLKISDTGVGIPAKELPHMFERFHRIENSAGRTHEGTGIGLSLVHELVQLHGGEITVDSAEGIGSAFTVKIPVGKAHLPQEQVLQRAKDIDSTALKGSFIQEAFSLLNFESGVDYASDAWDGASITRHQESVESKETRILIVDDNADMRAYLTRILKPYFSTENATNGAEALNKVRQFKPDLILSDIMMPVMDGKTMLEHIRSTQEYMRLPVIFLSARAGEEARIDGIEAGADDYLVKPFSAAELLAKIRAQIRIAKIRSHSENQLRNLIIEAPVAIAIYRGKSHVIEMANTRMLQYWGRSEDEILKKTLPEAIPEMSTQGFIDIMDEVYKTGERFVSGEVPIQLFRLEQEQRMYINLTVEPLKEESGRIYGLMAVAADVTQQVSARVELEKLNDTLNLAVDAANMGIWRLDLKTNNVFVSERARIIHGLPLSGDLSFAGTSELIIKEHREVVLGTIASAIDNKGFFNENYQILPIGSNKPRWLNTSGRVEINDEQEAVSVIGTILDITESKEDSQRKDDFIGMVSHELKTPLTSLNGYSQVLQMHAKRTNDDFATNKLEKVVTQVKKMSALINGFLNVSRLEAGKIHLNLQKFDIVTLINEIIEETEVSFSQHTLNYFPKNAIEVYADRDKIGSVLSNLLSNAIKYSPGSKTVDITSVVHGTFARVSVRDFGMGIKPQELNKLFERFYRIESDTMQNISGFGIGLYLCAEIIERHGGTIGVDSEFGHGSTFFFQIPLS